MKQLSTLVLLLVISFVSNAQIQIGYAPMYSTHFTDSYGGSVPNKWSFVNFYVQGRISDRWDYKLNIGDSNPDWIEPYIKVGFPFYVYKPDTSSSRRNAGLYIEPSLSYQSHFPDTYGVGLGIGYSRNVGSFNFQASVNTSYESSSVSEFFNPTDPSKFYGRALRTRFMFGVGYWLPRIKRRPITTEEQENRKTRIWASATIGTDDFNTLYGGRIEAAFKGVEWLSIGAEYTQIHTESAHMVYPNPPVITYHTLDLFYFRADIRPVQIFSPLSKWDPYIGFGVGPGYEMNEGNYSNYMTYFGAQAGMRYWATDHLGIGVEYGIWAKLGLFGSVSYRL